MVSQSSLSNATHLPSGFTHTPKVSAPAPAVSLLVHSLLVSHSAAGAMGESSTFRSLRPITELQPEVETASNTSAAEPDSVPSRCVVMLFTKPLVSSAKTRGKMGEGPHF